MANSEKKLSNRKKALIKDGILSGVNVAGGITGLALASNVAIKALSAATLGVGGVWIFLTAKLVSAIIKKKDEPVGIAYAFDKKDHKREFKQAKALKKSIIKEEKAEVKSKTSSKTKKEAKQEIKALAKPNTKRYTFARGVTITLAAVSAVIALGTTVFFADNFISAGANANESNSEVSEYLEVESAKDNAAGIIIGAVNVANAVVAAVYSSKMKRYKQDEFTLSIKQTQDDRQGTSKGIAFGVDYSSDSDATYSSDEYTY